MRRPVKSIRCTGVTVIAPVSQGCYRRDVSLNPAAARVLPSPLRSRMGTLRRSAIQAVRGFAADRDLRRLRYRPGSPFRRHPIDITRRYPTQEDGPGLSSNATRNRGHISPIVLIRDYATIPITTTRSLLRNRSTRSHGHSTRYVAPVTEATGAFVASAVRLKTWCRTVNTEHEPAQPANTRPTLHISHQLIVNISSQ